MKKSASVFLLNLFCLSFCIGQNGDTSRNSVKSLFKNWSKENNITGYGYPEVEFTTVNNNFAVVVGGGGGMLIRRSVHLGIFGRGISSKPLLNEGEYISGGWGGVQLGYTPDIESILHLNFVVDLGYGGFAVKDNKALDKKGKKKTLERLRGFVITPKLGVEINITSFFILNLGVGYRFFETDDKKEKLKDIKLSGMSGFVALKFGKFLTPQ